MSVLNRKALSSSASHVSVCGVNTGAAAAAAVVAAGERVRPAAVAMLSIRRAATCLQLKPTGHEQWPAMLTTPSGVVVSVICIE